ncbi:transmembrane protein 94-like [Oryzias melastigma]|uniref:transmembrane protein 94-like n=1 Tax=Oryzias melastigma TaxID=30732 RepID=UPI00168CB7E9|nr:transmembrane protein 94-like [Oryzias melastigma]
MQMWLLYSNQSRNLIKQYLSASSLDPENGLILGRWFVIDGGRYLIQSAAVLTLNAAVVQLVSGQSSTLCGAPSRFWPCVETSGSKRVFALLQASTRQTGWRVERGSEQTCGVIKAYCLELLWEESHDLLLALDPLYPSQCSWETFGYATGGGFSRDAEGLSPLKLSGQLNSLGCSVSFHQGDSVSMVKLIEQARHTTSGIRKCFLFLLQCQLSLVIIQFLACLIQLPPPINTTDILWVSCFSCPLLSVSLLGKPPDSSVMTVATGKNLDSIPKKTQNYFLGCFLLKFGLTVCAYLLAFGFTLQAVCPPTPT